MSSSSAPAPGLEVDAEFPEAFQELFRPHRYKVAYGGRGGAKSWAFARALLIQGVQRPLRVLCAREFQNSIDESVHQLLSDQIGALNLGGCYDVRSTEIIGPAGTAFGFDGLRRNVSSIKSAEGIDIVWVEEATDVSKHSWETLIPTIRKDDSEIWVSFNPELDTDETFVRFVTQPPPGAWVKKVTWADNPWFPKVLDEERRLLKERDPDAYLTIWEGHTRQFLDGAIYANEIRAATAQERITAVPYEVAKPVHTFWDLGKSDNTAIWFVQVVGYEFRVIDYYQANGQKLAHYVKLLKDKPYVYGEHWLPHDAKHDLLAADNTIEAQMLAHELKVRISPQVSVAQGIESARTVFGKCYFDAKKCADGLQCLRHYKYERKKDGMSFTREPAHTWASHGADAFRYMAVSLTGDKKWKPISYNNRGIV